MDARLADNNISPIFKRFKFLYMNSDESIGKQWFCVFFLESNLIVKRYMKYVLFWYILISWYRYHATGHWYTNKRINGVNCLFIESNFEIKKQWYAKENCYKFWEKLKTLINFTWKRKSSWWKRLGVLKMWYILYWKLQKAMHTFKQK